MELSLFFFIVGPTVGTNVGTTNIQPDHLYRIISIYKQVTIVMKLKTMKLKTEAKPKTKPREEHKNQLEPKCKGSYINEKDREDRFKCLVTQLSFILQSHPYLSSFLLDIK